MDVIDIFDAKVANISFIQLVHHINIDSPSLKVFHSKNTTIIDQADTKIQEKQATRQ